MLKNLVLLTETLIIWLATLIVAAGGGFVCGIAAKIWVDEKKAEETNKTEEGPVRRVK